MYVKKGNNGGARKGAGRPVASSTLYAQKFREELAKRIMADAESWYIAIEDAAKGHYVMQQTKDGSVRVYKKSPDAQAWDKGVDRAFGKVKQEMDVTTNGNGIGENNVNREQIKELLHDVLKYPRPHTRGDKSGT